MKTALLRTFSRGVRILSVCRRTPVFPHAHADGERHVQIYGMTHFFPHDAFDGFPLLCFYFQYQFVVHLKQNS